MAGLGLRNFRVRAHEEIARIELGAEELARFYADESLRNQLTEAVKEEGFRFVILDLEGFRSGSFNPRPKD